MEQTPQAEQCKERKETHISEEDTLKFISGFTSSYTLIIHFACAFPAYPGDNFHNKIRRVKHNLFLGGGGGDGLITVDPSPSNISISINP